MAFPPPVMFARFLNVISRPRSKANHRVFRSKRDAACSPNTDRLHRQRKSTPIAPICSRISVNIFDDCWRCRYPHGPLAFIRRQETVRCRLGWMSHLRSKVRPLSTASYINQLIALRSLFNELAWSEELAELVRLIRREDFPRPPQRLPRPLTLQQDQLLQQEFRRRNDLGGNVFLLLRHTGMRIGECADLSCDCLRSTGSEQWAIHVPLGKLKTERMVPVDFCACELVQRLAFFRSLDLLPADGRLLARASSKEALVRQLRDYLHQVCRSEESRVGKEC